MTDIRKGNNPFVTDAMHGFAARAFGEEGIYYDHLEGADRRPVEQCIDGHDVYFHPNAGTYVCQQCWDTKGELPVLKKGR